MYKATREGTDWHKRAASVRRSIKIDPGNHRSWTELSLVLYESGDHEAAVKAAIEAVGKDSDCPRALWSLACCLQLAGLDNLSISLFEYLLVLVKRQRGRVCCATHKALAKGLVSDAWARMSYSLKQLGRKGESEKAFEHALDLRGPGCYSIYPLMELGEPAAYYRAYRRAG